MRLIFRSLLISALFVSVNAKASALNCDPALIEQQLTEHSNTSALHLSHERLYQMGHYTLALNAFNLAEKVGTESVGVLLSTIYRYRQLCGQGTMQLKAHLTPYLEAVEILENSLDHDELNLLAGLWLEKNAGVEGGANIANHLSEIFLFSSVKRVETVLLHMQGGANSTLTKTLMKTLKQLNVNIVLADSSSGDFMLDNLIDEHLVDLVISDAYPYVSQHHEQKVYRIGKDDSSKWSMSFHNELWSILQKLSQEYSKVVVYSMNSTDIINSLSAYYPSFEFVDFRDFNHANSYFSSRVCKRESVGCISPLDEQVSLIVGNTKQTVYINTFLRVAQNPLESRKRDAKVYITSMSTWAGLSVVEKRDMANTMIYDSKWLPLLELGYSQGARVTALITDIIAIHEQQSVGVDFSVIPFIGYSGSYFIDENNVRREISVNRLSDLK